MTNINQKEVHSKILVLLGRKDEYLGYKSFATDDELDNYLESIRDLMILNIQGDLPLRKRLLSLPKDSNGTAAYFAFAGAVQGFDVIDLDPTEDDNGED